MSTQRHPQLLDRLVRSAALAGSVALVAGALFAVGVGSSFRPTDAGAASSSWLRFVGGEEDLVASSALLDFDAPTAGRALLEVTDESGQRVALIFVGTVAAGRHDAAWDGCDDSGARVAAGVYLARLELGGETVVTELSVR